MVAARESSSPLGDWSGDDDAARELLQATKISEFTPFLGVRVFSRGTSRGPLYLFAPAIREVGIWLSSATDPTDAIDVDDLSVRMDAEVNVPPPVADPLASVPEWPFLEGVPRSLEIAFQDLAVTPVGNQELVDDGGSLKRASSVEGAVDGITQAMRGVLREGDLSVVWLFDASNSLVDDRQRIAVRLESFLSDLAAGDSSDTSPRLLNTVVSFGSRMKELVRPTASRERVVDSIRDMPVDPSGIENVFAAMAQCVETYGASSQRHSLMLVVWTDESGDDAGKLEQVIRLCRGRDVAVHVVGPSAVLGADTGFHAYTDPKTDLEYLLPVTRGPDSPMEERIRLDYWFRMRSPLRGEAGERSLQLPAWYGGRDLAGISSGFSPYALTRLAVETGGTFTIFDKPSDRPPFDLDVLKDYLPHYGSAADYAARIELHPLRLAISQAVKVTRGRTQLSVPPLMLFGEESPIPPHRFEAPYLQPKQFASQLRTAAQVSCGKPTAARDSLTKHSCM